MILTSQNVLHGVQVNKLKGEEYKLIWKDQPDFVRMAAKTNALVVPFAAVGGESLRMGISHWQIVSPRQHWMSSVLSRHAVE